VLTGSFAMTGFFPVAPATFASAVVTPLVALAYQRWSTDLEQAAICAGILAVGIWSSGKLEKLYGKDPSAAVIDEVLGMAIALVHAPITPLTLVLAFLLFRVFDVLKLPPGRRLEKLPGGWGIMMDDLSAGVYASVVLQVVLRLWPQARLAAWHVGLLVILGGLLFAFRKPLLRRYGKKRCDPRLGLSGGEARQ
jgi:phosphatidylglycerophosphatase A